MPRILLTGATGFLGRELLVRLLAKGDPILLAIRRREAEDAAAARERIRDIVERTAAGVSIAPVEIAFADVRERGLGLDQRALAWLGTGPVHIVHGAAEVRFDLPYEQMRQQNVLGTENVLALARDFAERGALVRLDYVSTAFIAGDRVGVAREDEIDVGQSPRNAYERSKLEAERAVAAARAGGLPVTVHRPSIIVGDSRTGRTSSFKVLYWPLKLYARGRWRTVFGRPSCPIDVVPVDYVADAMAQLLYDPKAVGRTIHLAAGPERQATIHAIASQAEAYFGGGRIRYLSPEIYFRYLRPIVRPIIRWLRPDVAEGGAFFLPYLISNPSFALDESARLLAPHGIVPPRVEEYFEAIMRYARDTDFGRQPLLTAGGS